MIFLRQGLYDPAFFIDLLRVDNISYIDILCTKNISLTCPNLHDI